MLKARLLGAVGIVAVVGVITGVLGAQTPASPAFEVASIKPTKTQGVVLDTVSPGGRFTATNTGLGMLIKRAYGLQDDQLVGGPSWMQSESFDVEAKALAAVAALAGWIPAWRASRIDPAVVLRNE